MRTLWENLKHLKLKWLNLKDCKIWLFMYLKLSSVPRASRIRPLQYAEESEEFSLWNASQLQRPTGLANNWGNYMIILLQNIQIYTSDYLTTCTSIYYLLSLASFMLYHDLYTLSSSCVRPPPAAWGPSSVSNAKPSSMEQLLTLLYCSASLWG